MIHNISIATDDDIIQIGDDVKYTLCIYLGHLSFWEIVLICEKRPLFQTVFLSISCKPIWVLTYGH